MMYYLKVENKQDFIIKKWTEKEAVFKKNGTGVIRSELPCIDTLQLAYAL